MADSIDVPVWWRTGGMSYRRDALGGDHPEQTYNYVKRTYGVEPEEYGIFPAPGYSEADKRAIAYARAEAAGWI